MRSKTISGLAVVGLLLAACAKQNAPQPQPEDLSAGAATETQPAPPSPVASAAPPADTAPSAEVPAATEGTRQGGSAAVAPTSKATPTSSTKPAPNTTTKAPTAPTAADAPATPPAAAKYTGDSPCLATSFKFAAVRNACEHGGRPEAKALMKTMTKKAEAAGTELKCNSCHTSLKTYELKDNAVADLRKWL
ncbi:MAG TPA: hypothetical protein VHO25_12060 [Polyangiaceae bacterium]|nr:hypothetical protein [Polyangiaceae bacterium]